MGEVSEGLFTCFVLYPGSSIPVAEIAWDPQEPGFHVRDLDERSRAITRHFSRPHVKYLGSDQGCGCGFRHVNHCTDEWDAPWMEEDTMVIEGSRSNHLQLHTFLTGLFQCGHDGVELYGCWDGDFDEDAGEPLAIQLSAISDEKFHFRERRLYILSNPEAGVVTAIG